MMTQTFLSLRNKRSCSLGVLLVLVLAVGQASVPAKAASFLSGYVFDFAAGEALGAPADAAQAAFDATCPGVCHTCNKPECTISAKALSYGAKSSINVAIEALEELINYYLGQVKGAMTKLANQRTNNLQNTTNSLAATNDAVSASSAADTIAETRTVNTARLVPSTSACRIASRDTVDDRMENPSLGTSPSGKPQSLQSVRMLAWADFGTAYEDAKRRASQPLGSNYDDLGPLVGDVNKIYLQLYNNLERLAAIKATRLARLIKQNSAGGAGVTARTINN